MRSLKKLTSKKSLSRKKKAVAVKPKKVKLTSSKKASKKVKLTSSKKASNKTKLTSSKKASKKVKPSSKNSKKVKPSSKSSKKVKSSSKSSKSSKKVKPSSKSSKKVKPSSKQSKKAVVSKKSKKVKPSSKNTSKQIKPSSKNTSKKVKPSRKQSKKAVAGKKSKNVKPSSKNTSKKVVKIVVVKVKPSSKQSKKVKPPRSKNISIKAAAAKPTSMKAVASKKSKNVTPSSIKASAFLSKKAVAAAKPTSKKAVASKKSKNVKPSSINAAAKLTTSIKASHKKVKFSRIMPTVPSYKKAAANVMRSRKNSTHTLFNKHMLLPTNTTNNNIAKMAMAYCDEQMSGKEGKPAVQDLLNRKKITIDHAAEFLLSMDIGLLDNEIALALSPPQNRLKVLALQQLKHNLQQCENKKDELRNLNLQFTLQPINNDGWCFFYAILTALGESATQKDAMALNNQVADWLANNKKLPFINLDGTLMTLEEFYNLNYANIPTPIILHSSTNTTQQLLTFDQYISESRKVMKGNSPVVWPEVTIVGHAIANIKKIQLDLYSATSGALISQFQPLVGLSPGGRVVSLRQSTDHYDLFVPK